MKNLGPSVGTGTWQPEEDDLKTHVANVLVDYRAGLLDSLEDAVEAILEHPEIKSRRDLKPIDVLRTR